MSEEEQGLLVALAVKRLVRVASGADISVDEARKNGNVVLERHWHRLTIQINYWIPGVADFTFVLDGDKAETRLYEIGREERIEVAAAQGVTPTLSAGVL